jgi:hypothetical protein
MKLDANILLNVSSRLLADDPYYEYMDNDKDYDGDYYEDYNYTSSRVNGTYRSGLTDPEEETKVAKTTTLIVSEIVGVLFMICLGCVCLYFTKNLC